MSDTDDDGKDGDMLDIKASRTIDKPIDEVWRFVIDGFTSNHEWAAGTTLCRAGTEAEGFDRICHTESGTLTDTITLVDDVDHVLEFTVEGLPFFVRSVVSTWSLRRISDDATEITIGPRIETMSVIGRLFEIPMKRALEKLYPELLADMAVFVETGRPSARKQRELADAA
ncbi:MAG: SRPBCC family protein [Actinomycetota bacterium]